MKYVPPIGGGANDPYIDANPASGTEGSAVPAAAIEHPMREILEVISAAGIAPSEANLAQLLAALRSSGVFQTQATNDSSTKAATTAFANPASSIGTSGYQKLPSGLIIQWGSSGSISSVGSLAITLPIAFPNAALSVSMCRSASSAQDTDNNTVSAEMTLTTLTLRRSSDSSLAGSFFWIAIGY